MSTSQDLRPTHALSDRSVFRPLVSGGAALYARARAG